MTPDSDQLELYGMMKEAWGDRLASAVYDRLPPMDRSDLATTTDLDGLAAVLRVEMSELRGELRVEMSELRHELRDEMSELRHELRGETSELRGELRGEMSELRGEMSQLRGELRGEMSELRGELRASARHTIVTIVAAAVSIWLTFYLPAVL